MTATNRTGSHARRLGTKTRDGRLAAAAFAGIGAGTASAGDPEWDNIIPTRDTWWGAKYWAEKEATGPNTVSSRSARPSSRGTRSTSRARAASRMRWKTRCTHPVESCRTASKWWSPVESASPHEGVRQRPLPQRNRQRERPVQCHQLGSVQQLGTCHRAPLHQGSGQGVPGVGFGALTGASTQVKVCTAMLWSVQ